MDKPPTTNKAKYTNLWQAHDAIIKLTRAGRTCSQTQPHDHSKMFPTLFVWHKLFFSFSSSLPISLQTAFLQDLAPSSFPGSAHIYKIMSSATHTHSIFGALPVRGPIQHHIAFSCYSRTLWLEAYQDRLTATASVPLFWSTLEFDCCVLTYTNKLHQRGKHNMVWLQWTKHCIFSPTVCSLWSKWN